MDKIKKLVETKTVSGYEYMGTETVKKMFEEAGTKCFIDTVSNVVGIKNEKGFAKVLLDAHIDTIGLMVTEIKEGGFLKFVKVGGVDERILPSLKVVVHGKRDIKGVIGVKPPHLLKGDRDSAYKVEDLFIDTGLLYDELTDIVEIGDIITFDSEFTALLNNKIAGAGLDDKLGVYAVSEILKNVDNKDIALFAAATISEETGLNGASVIGNLNEFDLAIVIDVTHGTTPDAIKERAFNLGNGPVITFGPALSKKYNDKIKSFAKENSINLQIEVESGNTGTNAWEYHSAGTSIPSVMVSIPLKYMHTSYEVCDLNDVNGVISLVSGFLNSLKKEDF